jgi:hypothetical protein
VKRLLTVIFSAVVLVGCAGLPDLGPTVNTNAQVGAENTQQVVANQTNTTNEVQGNQSNSRDLIEAGEASITINNSPLWLIVLAILGWMLPTPLTIIKAGWYSLPFTNKKDKGA